MFGVLEKRFVTVQRERIRRMGESVFGELENTCSANWRIRSANWRLRVRRIGEYVRRIGDYVFVELENTFGELEITCSVNWRFGETWSATMLVEPVMKWRKNPVIVSGDLNHSGEKMEKIYGNQNFIHHKVESTYLRCFKDRNV